MTAEDPKMCKSIRTYFRQYCQCTTIHGFRYFGEKRTIFERIWWGCMFAICLAACSISIYTVYKKWEGSPVIVNFANQGTPVYNIPFPAITICPDAKSVQTKFNFTQILHKKFYYCETVTQSEHTMFEYMALICTYQSSLRSEYSNPNVFSEEFFEVLDEIKADLDLFDCRYLGASINCTNLFVPIITDEGICYSFNMLDRSEIFRNTVVQFKDYHRVQYSSRNWSVEHGYTSDAGLTPYPNRTLLAGAANGLSFRISTPKLYLDYGCTPTALQGYKVILHAPMRIPRPSQEYFRVPLDQGVVAAVQPIMISTSDKVKMYRPARRGCYFPSERYLKFFKIYTSLNCQLECVTNYTLSQCGCVNFYMPRENGTNICGTGKLRCLKNAEKNMHVGDLQQKLSETKNAKSTKSVCDCLPICTDVTYNTETSQSDWHWQHVFTAYNYSPPNDTHFSSLTIFFKTDNFITSERNELYGPSDFLANFGGLLGLFTGFSILSFLEIVYFLTVRLICNWRLYGHWAGVET